MGFVFIIEREVEYTPVEEDVVYSDIETESDPNEDYSEEEDIDVDEHDAQQFELSSEEGSCSEEEMPIAPPPKAKKRAPPTARARATRSIAPRRAPTSAPTAAREHRPLPQTPTKRSAPPPTPSKKKTRRALTPRKRAPKLVILEPRDEAEEAQTDVALAPSEGVQAGEEKFEPPTITTDSHAKQIDVSMQKNLSKERYVLGDGWSIQCGSVNFAGSRTYSFEALIFERENKPGTDGKLRKPFRCNLPIKLITPLASALKLIEH